MKMIRFLMVFCLLLTVAGMSMAQVSSDQNQSMGSSNPQMSPSTGTENAPSNVSTQPMSSENLKATVQPGPVLGVRPGLPPSADVFVGKRLAIRVGASAGGLSPMRRAQIIADRLNQAFAAGYSWQNMRVAQVNGMWTVSLGEKTIATADTRSARAQGMSPGRLANSWASNTVVAMGGQPQMIAAQLQPIRERVAGSQQQLGRLSWTTQNTKSVPLFSSSTGSQLGNVTVAGSQNALNAVNSVVVYQSTSGQATIWTFVPITGTSTSGTLARVLGVGLNSMPSSLLPTTGFSTGPDVLKTTNRMGMQWNNMIDTTLMQDNLQPNANTKIVPLYSMDDSKVIGAAQIIGSARGVRQAQAVIASTSDNMLKFGATTSQCTPMMGQPSPLGDVVVSSIIMISPSGVPPTMPSATPPSVTPPSPAPSGATQPGTTETPAVPGE